MDNERDPNTSYRIEVTWPAKSDTLVYHITVYRPSKHQSLSVPIVGVRCREDTLPSWVLTAITLLDMAAQDGVAAIPSFGSKSGNVYWLHAKQVYTDGREEI